MDRRPMIFIDEISRPLIMSIRNGYEEELRAFYDTFLDIDHYEKTSGIYTTSFAPENTKISYGLKYIKDISVSCDSYYGQNTNDSTSISNTSSCCNANMYYSLSDSNVDYNIKLPIGWPEIIAEKRKWIEEKRVEHQLFMQQEKERSIREYKANFQSYDKVNT